jgi:hypothetical protein
MSDYMYILIFIFAGCAWAGLLLIGVALWIGFTRLTNPTSKPTQWAQEWQKIEEDISR